MSIMQINLITSFYTSSEPERNAELRKALDQNINSRYVECLHLFVDDKESYNYLEKHYTGRKIIVIAVGKQPLYSDLFEYANKLNKLCMITNSDIWLYTVENIHLINNMKNNDVFALTRHEYDLSKPFIDGYQGSHDAFIFRSPIDKNIIKHLKFPQNVWGSENVVLYELSKLKYKLYNPCIQIKIVHEHKTEERNADRPRINLGDIDGDGVFKVRTIFVKPKILNIFTR